MSSSAARDKTLDGDEIVDIPLKSAPSELLRVAGKVPAAGWFIVLTEFCERFAYYGASNAFQNYVQFPPQTRAQLEAVKQGRATLQPGALGKGQSKATLLNQFFTFFCYVTPVLGAFVSDQYWGKFRTIWVFSLIYLLGWTILTVTAVPYKHDYDGTPIYGNVAYIGFIISLVVIGIGTGGIKSVVSPMCADQVPQTEETVKTTKKGDVLVDRDLTIQHLYQWFYWAINIGAFSGQLLCTYLERTKDGFWKAFLLPSCMFLVSVFVFISARNKYIVVPPKGSILIECWRCVRYARRRQRNHNGGVQVQTRWVRFLKIMTWMLMSPFLLLRALVLVPRNYFIRKRAYSSPSTKPEQTFKFLEYAKPLPNETPAEALERTWEPSFPDELRKTLKACTIYGPLSIYWLTYTQMTNNLISQAGQMERPHWLNNDLLTLLDPIVLVALLPLFDQIFYPLLQKYKIKFAYMKRIAFGFVFGALAMGWASFVQHMIYDSPPYYDHPLVDDTGVSDTGTPNRISIAWQVPAYVFIAISETIAALLGMLLSPLAQDPHMMLFYACIAVVAFIAGIWFWMAFAHFDAEDEYAKSRGYTENPEEMAAVHEKAIIDEPIER